MGLLFLLLLMAILFALIPTWRYSRPWGYGPSAAISRRARRARLALLLGRLLAQHWLRQQNQGKPGLEAKKGASGR